MFIDHKEDTRVALKRIRWNSRRSQPTRVPAYVSATVLAAIMIGAASGATAAAVPTKIAGCDAHGALVAVLPHYQSPFTHQFVVGGQAAAKQCNAKVTTTAPASIDPPTQLRDFQDLLSKGVKAVVTVAYPSNLWI